MPTKERMEHDAVRRVREAIVDFGEISSLFVTTRDGVVDVIEVTVPAKRRQEFLDQSSKFAKAAEPLKFCMTLKAVRVS